MSREREWFELPRGVAAGKLIEIRNELRQKNLYDTEDPPHPATSTPDAAPEPAVSRTRVRRSKGRL